MRQVFCRCNAAKEIFRLHRAILAFPSEGKPKILFAAERLKGELRPVRIVRPVLTPHADTPCGCGVSTHSGGQGGIPLAALSFRVFLSPEKEKRIGSDDVGKSLSANQNPTNGRFVNRPNDSNCTRYAPEQKEKADLAPTHQNQTRLLNSVNNPKPVS